MSRSIANSKRIIPPQSSKLTIYVLCLASALMSARSLVGEEWNGPSLHGDDSQVLASSVESFLYHCPSVTSTTSSENYEPVLFADYEKSDNLMTDMNDLVGSFRTTKMGDWGGLTYEQVKGGLRDWKTKYFLPNLQTGDRIYESASGMGFNLLFTMELLAEQERQVTDLTLYGNEYLASSARQANTFLPQAFSSLPELFENMAEFGLREGICQGDSTRLEFVPSSSFDIVYTGYVLPIHDVLGLAKISSGLSAFDVHSKYVSMCRAVAADPEGSRDDAELLEHAQERQEDFYAAWVGEMIRIAKPGKPILVEHVSRPKCEEPMDNGGVSKEWWERAIQKYGWPVDPQSLAFMDDTIFQTNRYHVFIRKAL